MRFLPAVPKYSIPAAGFLPESERSRASDTEKEGEWFGWKEGRKYKRKVCLSSGWNEARSVPGRREIGNIR